MHHSKLELIDKEKNMLLSGDVMLEPRLQEYLKKKTFYRKNNIEPCISPELEYQITPFDKKILKSFLSGKKDVHNSKYYDRYANKQEQEEKQYFPSKEFRDDKRVPKIEKQDPNAKLPINRGMFAPENNGRYYEDTPNKNKDMMISPRDFPPYEYDGTGYNISESKFNPRIDSKIDPGPGKFSEIYQKNNSQYRINPDPYKKTTDPDPRNKYIISNLLAQADKLKAEIGEHNKQQVSEYNEGAVYKDYKLLDNVKNPKQEARYGQDNIPTYNNASDMDLDNKVVVPNMACNSKRGNDNFNYRFEPYLERKDRKNEETENELVRGMSSYRTHNRSYGYRNPEEHYFQYVDDDFQSSEQIEPWVRGGEGSRMQNKAIAKNKRYTREIM